MNLLQGFLQQKMVDFLQVTSQTDVRLDTDNADIENCLETASTLTVSLGGDVHRVFVDCTICISRF